jgi:hypothetical protein
VIDLNKQACAAVEAIARSISAAWNPSDSYTTVSGKRVGLKVATLKRLTAGKDATAKIRLRFDKVAARVVASLQAAADEIVPGEMTVVVTITAPIRLASKTISSLEELIRSLVARKWPRRDAKATIQGNRVRIRILRSGSERAPKLVGFVHNSDSDSLLLLDMTQELL